MYPCLHRRGKKIGSRDPAVFSDSSRKTFTPVVGRARTSGKTIPRFSYGWRAVCIIFLYGCYAAHDNTPWPSAQSSTSLLFLLLCHSRLAREPVSVRRTRGIDRSTRRWRDRRSVSFAIILHARLATNNVAQMDCTRLRSLCA